MVDLDLKAARWHLLMRAHIEFGIYLVVQF